MGVFCRSCSSFSVALKGPAERSPAEGRPDEGIGSRNADVREMADRGVFPDIADGSDTAERSSEAGGAILGKFAVTGVDSLRAGLDDMMAARVPGRCQGLGGMEGGNGRRLFSSCSAGVSDCQSAHLADGG